MCFSSFYENAYELQVLQWHMTIQESTHPPNPDTLQIILRDKLEVTLVGIYW